MFYKFTSIVIMSSYENNLLLESVNFIILHSLLQKIEKNHDIGVDGWTRYLKVELCIMTVIHLAIYKKKKNEMHFKNFCRTFFLTFNELLNYFSNTLEMVPSIIEKQDSQLRKAIPANERYNYYKLLHYITLAIENSHIR